MQQRLLWERDGRQWPHREASSFTEAAGLRWHVQTMAPPAPGAPTVWLLHGTGASTHSWRGLLPRLAQNFRVLAIDLPGHGFTGMPAMVQGDSPATPQRCCWGLGRLRFLSLEGLSSTISTVPATVPMAMKQPSRATATEMGGLW